MLQVENLSFVYHPGSFGEIQALDRIDLSLGDAEFAAVIGSNGAGKTTLFNLIAGVLPVQTGRIAIDGIEVNRLAEYRRAAGVGRVFQDPRLGTAAQMTIAENLTLAELRGQPLKLKMGVTARRKAAFQELVAPLGLGLERRLDERVASLSGGQRQALTLLVATLTRPKILLLDEHTAALDPATAIKILDLTRSVVSEKRLTTLMITHNMQLALDFGSRLLMMDQGKIVLDLSAAQKSGMAVQDLVNLFQEVKHERLTSDELLLT